MEGLINKWKNTVDQHNKKLTKLRDDSRSKSCDKHVVLAKRKDSSSSSEEKIDDPHLQDLMPLVLALFPNFKQKNKI